VAGQLGERGRLEVKHEHEWMLYAMWCNRCGYEYDVAICSCDPEALDRVRCPMCDPKYDPKTQPGPEIIKH
jgi:hypothetical protein